MTETGNNEQLPEQPVTDSGEPVRESGTDERAEGGGGDNLPPDADTRTALKILSELRDSGALSETEFRDQKGKLLG